MSRVIKFRTWYENRMWPASVGDDGHVCIWKDSKDCAEGEEWGNYCIGHCLENNNILNPVDNLMQFTGLKDKNGRDVWEGDLVNGLLYLGSGGYYIGKVIWSKTGFIAIPTGKFSEGYADIDSPHIEVIGNIYENES